MIDKASSKRFEGWPLDSLSINKENGKYFVDGSIEESKENIIKDQYQKSVVDFLIKSLRIGEMRQLEFPENIQAIVGGKEYSLDNAVLKIWPESEETKGALCVEMEGVGLFTIANYRKCVATGIYVVSDVYSENDWKLGWEGNDIKRAVGAVIDMIIESIR